MNDSTAPCSNEGGQAMVAAKVEIPHVPYRHQRYSLGKLRRKLARGSFCVTVEREFGYQCWLWFPQILPQILIQKWKAAPTWGRVGWQAYLGGRWVGEMDYLGYQSLGPTPYAEFLDLWRTRNDYDRYFIANLCCDADSYLWTPDGRSFVHQGYTGTCERARHPAEDRAAKAAVI